MKRNGTFLGGWCAIAAMTIALSGNAQAENTGTQHQPLVAGTTVDVSTQEDFGLLSLINTFGNTSCSASLLRNDWVITAAHCVEFLNSAGNPTPDPDSHTGQNVIFYPPSYQLTANWKTIQVKNGIAVTTFRPYDIALIKVASPFSVHGSTTGYSRLIFQDGQFPYFGEPVGANILVFGAGTNVLAQGQGNSATPSQNDGQYRMGYFRPTRDDDHVYWYPGSSGEMIAGGDSGGPSLAWVLSGYALVGVHSSAHVQFVPGKPTAGWTWVSSVSEAADAPIAPIIPALFAIMGPVPPADPDPPVTYTTGVFSRTPPDYQPIWLYGIQPDGKLIWYRRDSNAVAWQGPKTVGVGWAGFKDVIPAGGNRFYALTQDDRLIWYEHDGFNDGSFNWKPPVEVGSGWAFSRIFSGGDGVVYAIRQDGKLFWYRNIDYRDGTRAWLDAREVGSGWGGFKDVFSMGQGAVYAVKTDGTLLLYQEKDFDNGARAWYDPETVGTGWGDFQQIIPAGNGVILAIQSDGTLLWYRHYLQAPSVAFGRVKEIWEGPIKIGSGWQDFSKVVALLPETELPVVR